MMRPGCSRRTRSRATCWLSAKAEMTSMSTRRARSAGVEVGHVEGVGHHLEPLPTEAVGGSVQALRVAAVEDDLSAGAAEPSRHGQPESTGRTGNKRPATGEAEDEPGRQVELSSVDEGIVSPQRESLVADSAGMVDVRIDQPAADAVAPGRRVDEEKPQLPDRRAHLCTEHAARPSAGLFSDPSPLGTGPHSPGEAADDPGTQRLEGHFPAEVGRVLLAVRHDHPTEVARLPERPDPRDGLSWR
jgi:hypothetical protein